MIVIEFLCAYHGVVHPVRENNMVIKEAEWIFVLTFNLCIWALCQLILGHLVEFVLEI